MVYLGVTTRSRIIIVSNVLYGCGTRSFAFREVHRLRKFENRLLRRMVSSKTEKKAGIWGNLHRGELSFVLFAAAVRRAEQ